MSLIDRVVAAVRTANDASGRLSAQRKLAVILTGHANAEEAVIYPALVARPADHSRKTTHLPIHPPHPMSRRGLATRTCRFPLAFSALPSHASFGLPNGGIRDTVPSVLSINSPVHQKGRSCA
jgi:hypothetical protein